MILAKINVGHNNASRIYTLRCFGELGRYKRPARSAKEIEQPNLCSFIRQRSVSASKGYVARSPSVHLLENVEDQSGINFKVAALSGQTILFWILSVKQVFLCKNLSEVAVRAGQSILFFYAAY